MTRAGSTRRGSSLVEALVAGALAGIALAAVALVARYAASGLRLARDTTAALTLAEGQLERLRAHPEDDGTDDVLAGGVRFSRVWSVRDGRGRPTRLAVEVSWDGHRVSLDTGVPP